jgi:phospholipid/cholesterol/gamma-HCH transport system ATP-binding protein
MPPAAGPDAIIEVRDFTAAFGDHILLKDLNFDVRRGEVFAILGRSGCGKSTLMKHMIGLHAPRRGSIRIDGDDITAADEAQRLRILRKFGVMYQSGALFGSMTLLENVRLPLEEFTDLPPEARTLIATMKLGLVGLEDFTQMMPSDLSGGMKKRGAIARAMALDPQILFLDEPSAGLDPITSAELDELILRICRTLGMTFVVVTHELPSIFTIADRMIMVDRQTQGILAEGRPQDLKEHSEDPRVRRFFHREGGSEP